MYDHVSLEAFGLGHTSVCRLGLFLLCLNCTDGLQVLYGNQSYHVVPYGAKYDADGTRITVHIDMTARQCSFEVDGTHFGVAFWSLPAQVYPAVSMRYGGKVKFITCMGVN